MSELRERLQCALMNRYTVERSIGSGGMAAVYLAEDLRHDRRVAIKVLHPELAAALGSDRFLREIQIAASLEHPHVLALIDSGDADGLPFYVMPYVEGESLRDRMERERPLPLDEALRIACEVADGLDYAHRQGVVHRDIKPANILLAEGHARIADFGVARAVGAATEGDATATGLTVGTPRYMSPEQAAGREADGRSDVYALGCVLYEMLAGEPPFGGPTPAAILAQKAMGEVPALDSRRRMLPPELARVVSRAMALEPVDRYATAREFKEALERPETERYRKRKKSKALRRVSAAALVISLLGAGAWLALRFQRSTASAPGASQLPAVAVVRFQNLSGDAELDRVARIVTNVLTNALDQVDSIRVVEVAPPDSLSGPILMRELRDQTAAAVAVQGSLYSTGDSLLIESRLVDTDRGELIEGLTASAPIEDHAAAVHRMREAILVAVATRFNLGDQYSASYGSAQSYEAWDRVAHARELRSEGGSERAALEELYRAIELDSTFDAARGLAMVWHVNLGEFDSADSIATELEQRIADLSPRTRWQLAVQQALMRRGRGELVRAMRDWKDRLPNASRYWHLALALQVAQRPHECLAALDSIQSGRGSWLDRAVCHHAAGEHGQGLESARQGREHSPDDLEFVIHEAKGLAATGDSEAALRLIAEALSDPALEDPYEHNLRFWLQVDVALELRAHGDAAAAADALERAIAWYRERTLWQTATAADRWRYARTLYAAGRWDNARAVFADLSAEELTGEPSLQAHNIDVSRLGYLGVLARRLGDEAVADSIDHQLATTQRPWLWGHASYWRAAMAAAAGDSVGATGRLAEAMDLGLFAAPWGVEYPKWDFHIDPDFESVRVYPPFQELIKPRG